MTLRLSSPASVTKQYLDQLVQDTALPLDQKTDCLKTLSVITKNLLDPAKSQDVKYRTLKLENAKLQAKLFSIPYILDLFRAVGFVQEANAEGQQVLVLKEAPAPNTSPAATMALELTRASEQLVSVQPTSNSTSTSTITATNKKPRTAATEYPMEKLSEKQKARRLLEEKEKMEKLKAKEERKRNIAMLKQDKHVRENDPNWKPGVSAACAKTGTGLQTFRDRHGES